ncbi:MAG TPA: alpha/beta hydrolase [Candidatus Copromorpha excrementigallinarum]|uniref:Alpha/beta hydrolase n=1 Tax=Candidatus Allocopromorpha excrementigallinarum TaxID=2840742 RepID=A0A9D1L698_9FIRM|nr:alpha/beta hydrolase [Candidatus Copromorpha excrementigallinarum]
MPYFATDDNCRLYYEEKGEGKAVVFVHGWSCNRHFFEKQLPEFRKRYKVLSYDLRGHGDSDRPEKGLYLARFAEDLRQLIEYRELKDVVLIGWSMGVHIIWEYINNYGCGNISKVVLIDMTAKMMADESENWPHTLFGKYDRADAMDYLEQIAQNWDSVAEGFVPAMFGENYPDKDEIEWILSMAKKNTPHVMVNMWLAIVQKDYRDMLDKITVPALITYGAKESLYKPENSQWLKDNIKGSQLAAFNGGHIHFLQDAENFNKTVIDFIEG